MRKEPTVLAAAFMSSPVELLEITVLPPTCNRLLDNSGEVLTEICDGICSQFTLFNTPLQSLNTLLSCVWYR